MRIVGRVEGDLSISAGESLRAETAEGIEVTGSVLCEGDGHVEGNLTCASLRARRGTLEITGTLRCRGEVDCQRGGLLIGQDLLCRTFEIGREARVGGSLQAERGETGGRLQVSKDASLSLGLEVGGALEVQGRLETSALEVGGRASLGSGKVLGTIEVGGEISVRGELDFEQLEVGGRILLGTLSRGTDLEVGGVLESQGELRLQGRLEAGGKVRLRGGLFADSVEVGGILEVKELRAKRVEVGGVFTAEGGVSVDRLEVGGRLSAGRVDAAELAEVGGHVETRRGFQALHLILSRDTRATGPLVAGRLEVGPHARIEDAWAQEAHLEHDARVRNLYADRLELDRDVRCEGDILYLADARVDPTARCAHPPRKVTQLPPAPSA